MQVKPQFKSYKVLDAFYLLSDDFGNRINLTEFEVVTKEDEVKTFFRVCHDKSYQWNNGAIGFDEVAYWKGLNRELKEFEINGIKIKEVPYGKHLLDKQGGITTEFIIQ